MGKYDDFNLDLNKVKARENIGAASTASWEWISIVSNTLATNCLTVDGSHTCNCPSTDCSPSDMKACANVEARAIINC